MPKLVVSALTRERPIMVTQLIESFGDMTVPPDYDVAILIVENDKTANTQQIIESCLPLRNGLVLTYVLEKELGIPIARNRAVQEAIAMEGDLLAFVDDDEIVATDWLCELVKAYETEGQPLVGGQVRVAAPVGDLNLMSAIMHDCVDRQFQANENRLQNAASDNPQIVATNNWLADLNLFTEDGLKFDESLRLTGGSDAKFTRDLWDIGKKSAHAPNAIVYATMPKKRLTFSYQFNEAKQRTMTRFHMTHSNRRFARTRLLVSVPIKTMRCVLLLAALPITRGRTLLSLATTSGWIAGRIGAAFGAKSKLYETTVGH